MTLRSAAAAHRHDEAWTSDREAPARSAGGLSEFFRYHGAWAPGVRLFRALRFNAKALIISLAFVVPLLGYERGLSASVIGSILGAFAIAAALIRVLR